MILRIFFYYLFCFGRMTGQNLFLSKLCHDISGLKLLLLLLMMMFCCGCFVIVVVAVFRMLMNISYPASLAKYRKIRKFPRPEDWVWHSLFGGRKRGVIAAKPHRQSISKGPTSFKRRGGATVINSLHIFYYSSHNNFKYLPPPNTDLKGSDSPSFILINHAFK